MCLPAWQGHGKVFRWDPPTNLGDCPQDRSWFDVAAVHAICIGAAVVEFSYF
jgi:hypothetical protein